MDKDYRVDYKEVVELFVSKIIPDLYLSEKSPQFNFVFLEDAFEYFEYVKNHPFEKKGYWTPNIEERDIQLLRSKNHYNDDHPTIFVKDYQYFFQYLTDIVNATNKFDRRQLARSLATNIFHYIWLRMSPSDFDDVEGFLHKQLDFIRDDTFYEDFYYDSNYLVRVVNVPFTYEGYKVKATICPNSYYDETTRHMALCLVSENGDCHTLPNIDFDIRSENGEKVCYVYAVQNDRYERIRNSKIERAIYKLNKGVKETESKEYIDYIEGRSTYYPENISDVHPNAVISLIIFTDILKEKGINHIKVPLLQVLNYEYHQILSTMNKVNFPRTWNKDSIEATKSDNNLKAQYEWEKNWYEHIVDKEDFISKNKTENLIRKFRRLCFHRPDVHIRNEVFNGCDYLDITLDKDKVKTKIG